MQCWGEECVQETQEGRHGQEGLHVYGWILNWSLRELELGMEWVHPSISTHSVELLERVSDCWLLKKHSAPWSEQVIRLVAWLVGQSMKAHTDVLAFLIPQFHECERRASRSDRCCQWEGVIWLHCHSGSRNETSLPRFYRYSNLVSYNTNELP
jgi:hypothetical protein